MGKHSKEEPKSAKSHSKHSTHKKHKKEKPEKRKKEDKKSKKHKKDKHNEKMKSSRSSRSSHESKTISGLPPAKQISEDDYFLKNEEFRVWCRLVRKCSFEAMNTEAARKLFIQEFVPAYNSGSLIAMYYEGIPHDIRDATTKTSHNWHLKVSEKERENLAVLADDIDFRTRIHTDGAWEHMGHHPSAIPGMHPDATQSLQGPSSSSSSSSAADTTLAKETKREEDMRKAKDTKKSYRDQINSTLDEIAPKAHGKEGLIDKKKGAAFNIHAAALSKEEDKDGLNMSESFTMGGGDDYHSTLARMNQRKGAQEERKKERFTELQHKEEQRKADFMASLGVDLTKGPIKIAPRTN